MKLLYRFIKWTFSRGTLPYWCIFAYDTLSVLVSGLFVYTLQYGVDNLYTNLNRVGLGIGLCMVLYMLAFFIFHTFNGVLRYSSFIDLRRVARSSFTASIAICVFHQLQIRFGLSNYILAPRFVSGVQIFITATMLMWTARMAAKALHDLYNNFGISKNVFIYGAQSGAVALARSIVSDPSSRYKIKGFISDNEMMTSSRISGIKVYEDSPELVETMRKLHVQALLISPLQTEHFTHDTKFIDALIAAKIKIMMMPPAEEWDGKSTISHTLLHVVDIEELLPRDKIEVDMEAIKKMLTGHRILITGAAGSIGSEMARQVATFKPSELILVDQAETPMHDVRLYMMNHHKDLKVWSIVGSITNESQMEQIFAAHKPEYVIHAAAYKHVPLMEENPCEAVLVNVVGSRNVADRCIRYGVEKMVMISTDKAVNPTNVMGCTKRLAEIYVQSLGQAIVSGRIEGRTQFITTRFGNVLGSNGSVIPRFREQIEHGGPVTVTHPEIRRYSMTIPEACRLVMEAATIGRGNTIFVFDMGECVKIAELARRMIALAGFRVDQDIRIVYTGLRPGEKLYEEVLSNTENTLPTAHEKIRIAKVREYDYEEACRDVEELERLAREFDIPNVVRLMKRIVPEYHSQNSRFEVYDRELEEERTA